MPDVHHSATTMFKRSYSSLFLTGILCLLVLYACKNSRKKSGDAIAHSPQELQQKTEDLIHGLIDYAVDNNGQIDDSIVLRHPQLVQMICMKNEFAPAWSENEKWKPLGDSLYDFISRAQFNGLFPEDYYQKELAAIRDKFFKDSTAKSDRRNAALWSKAELMLTDAFVSIVNDIKLGRLPQDSITLRKDSVLTGEFYLQHFNELRHLGSVTKLVWVLEPRHKGYQLLKAAIPNFLDSADYRAFTRVPPPEKTVTPDFRKTLQQRLFEGGYIAFDSVMADSSQLANAVKSFQQSKGITADGKAGEGTVRMLNLSDREKFIRIAISMDRYKMLPEKMPDQYIWVNLPSYYMQLIASDTVKLSSKIICGKTKTRTPLLTSAISEIITYPQWTVPASIIVKEILPAVKRNPGYLARKGFSLVDGKGEEVDPYNVEWSKYSKGIPYRVVQGSGDANALGVLKFNFPNKYAVYLHDTNQRYLFGASFRSLSHGCVRVQEWEKLAAYIIRNSWQEAEGRVAMLDSLNSWLGKKEKHSIPVKNKLPVFIRYFTCEGKNGSILFYDDIYGEDKMLREKYFTSK